MRADDTISVINKIIKKENKTETQKESPRQYEYICRYCLIYVHVCVCVGNCLIYVCSDKAREEK